MKKENKIEDINSFFTFLQEHMEEGGFKAMKSKFLLSDTVSYQLLQDGTYESEPLAFDDYVVYESRGEAPFVATQILTQYLWINPKRLSRREKIVHDNGIIYEDTTKYLYDELIELYKVWMRNLKKCFANSLMNDVSDVNRNSFNKGMLLKMNYFVELADDQEYTVNAQDGTSKNLLQEFLHDVLHWVNKQSLSIEVINKETADAVHILNLDNTVNKFNGMPLKMVWEYFKVLTTTKSKIGKSPLTEEQLLRFFKKVFIEGSTMSDSKDEFAINRGEKQVIFRTFYNFYSKSVASIQYEPTVQCREKYIKLLTDNFTNFDYKKVSANFNKYK